MNETTLPCSLDLPLTSTSSSLKNKPALQRLVGEKQSPRGTEKGFLNEGASRGQETRDLEDCLYLDWPYQYKQSH